MYVDSAVRLVNALVFIPNWKFTATDHTNRFESTILCRVDYPARNSNRDQAPTFPQEMMTYATCPIVVHDCDDICLYMHMVEMLEEIQIHEIREFLRVLPTDWAPFHPHRVEGMRRWAQMRGSGKMSHRLQDVMGDLRFGIG